MFPCLFTISNGFQGVGPSKVSTGAFPQLLWEDPCVQQSCSTASHLHQCCVLGPHRAPAAAKSSSRDKLLWEFFSLPPVCVVGFSFKCVLQQIAWVRVEVSASIWHRFPLDFQRLAMVRSWLCYRLCVTPGLIAVLSFPAAGMGGCRVLAPSEGRKCSEATLHFRSSFKLWRYVWGHGHWLRPTCMWVILDCFKNQVV